MHTSFQNNISSVFLPKLSAGKGFCKTPILHFVKTAFSFCIVPYPRAIYNADGTGNRSILDVKVK